jgi:pyruvate/2-oxoglutarate dehydrogenase complex dihydrolipoamide acyltransferase (E2) component
VEVFTDKLVAKIPSTVSGIVKEVNYAPDEICQVGGTLLTIEVEDQSPSPKSQTATASKADSDDSSSSSSDEETSSTKS